MMDASGCVFCFAGCQKGSCLNNILAQYIVNDSRLAYNSTIVEYGCQFAHLNVKFVRIEKAY